MTKKHEISEVGSVGLQRILHKRKRTKGDPLSVGKVTTKHQASKGYRTEGEREGLALSLRQQQHRGSLGGGASRKIKQRRMGIADSTNSYQRVFDLLIEARMTQKQTRDEAGEVVGEPGKPSGIVSGKGYNYKRVKKAIRRAEKLKAQKVSDKDMDDRTSATGVAGSVPSLQGLKDRSRKQGRGQDIEGMAAQMRKDPDAFASPTRFTPDSRNPYHQKYTQIGGRTRQAIHRRVKGKPMDMLTLPSELHAGSAERHAKWVASGGREKVLKKLQKQGKHLRGQDHRLG